MDVRTLATETLYWVANQCCYLADKIEPPPQPTLVFKSGERGRVFGPDGMWHAVPAQPFPWHAYVVPEQPS